MEDLKLDFLPVWESRKAGSSEDTCQESYILLFPQLLSLQLHQAGTPGLIEPWSWQCS